MVISDVDDLTTSSEGAVNSLHSLPGLTEVFYTRFAVDLMTVAVESGTENGPVTTLVGLFFLGE